jgi:CRISPR/Cas system-associated exonuclease Cas4 (RecB family)
MAASAAQIAAELVAMLAASEPQVIPTRQISKSKFVAGIQCLKRLHLQIYQPDLGNKVSLGIKEQGSKVGLLAQQAFPGGILVDVPSYEFEKARQETVRLMSDPKVDVLFEAAFLSDGVRVRVDILLRREGGWEVGEVKSSTKIKEHHIDDMSIQAYVLKRAGVNITRAVIIHLNPEYVYPGGEYDLAKLFVVKSVDLRADLWIKQELCEQFRVLQSPTTPVVNVGRQCTNPHDCEFKEHCYRTLRTDDLAYLPISNSDKWDKINALRQKTASILSVQLNTGFTEAERKRVKSAQVALKTGQIVVQGELGAELSRIKTPIAFMDFETLAIAIPRYVGMKPWQPIPIQYSVHLLDSQSLLQHREFLAEINGNDPRIAFIKSLLRDTAEAQTVVIWSPYEKTILTELAEAFPPYAEPIRAVIARLWDLCDVFKRCVYHAEFKGSFSLKKVLPALVPNLNYDDLTIAGLPANGESVLPAWQLMSNPTTSPEDHQRVRQELLQYCERDTFALCHLLLAVLKIH